MYASGSTSSRPMTSDQFKFMRQSTVTRFHRGGRPTDDAGAPPASDRGVRTCQFGYVSNFVELPTPPPRPPYRRQHALQTHAGKGEMGVGGDNTTVVDMEALGAASGIPLLPVRSYVARSATCCRGAESYVAYATADSIVGAAAARRTCSTSRKVLVGSCLGRYPRWCNRQGGRDKHRRGYGLT